MPRHPRLRLGAALWVAGMIGVVVLTFSVVPVLLAQMPGPLPLPVPAILAVSLAQSGVLLALMVWAGTALSGPLGLAAPVTAALVQGDGVAARAAFRRQALPGLLVGVASGALIVAATAIAPSALRAVGDTLQLGLPARMLYGGITEELLLRWGLMTLVAWLGWRFVQRGVGAPTSSVMVGANAIAALLFGAGHLPAVAALGVPLTTDVIAYIVAANAVPGFLFGELYWKRGLEAAMLAHATAHVVLVSCAWLLVPA